MLQLFNFQPARRPSTKAYSKEKSVAIKDIKPDAKSIKYATDKVILNKKIPHQNIVNIIGVYLSPQGILIVMELGSDSLKDIIGKRKDPLTSFEIIMFGSQIADVLNYCVTHHNPREPIYHHNLKTKKILIVNGQTKLADFGLAKACKQTEFSTRLSVMKSGHGDDVILHWQETKSTAQFAEGNRSKDFNGENVCYVARKMLDMRSA